MINLSLMSSDLPSAIEPVVAYALNAKQEETPFWEVAGRTMTFLKFDRVIATSRLPERLLLFTPSGRSYRVVESSGDFRELPRGPYAYGLDLRGRLLSMRSERGRVRLYRNASPFAVCPERDVGNRDAVRDGQLVAAEDGTILASHRTSRVRNDCGEFASDTDVFDAHGRFVRTIRNGVPEVAAGGVAVITPDYPYRMQPVPTRTRLVRLSTGRIELELSGATYTVLDGMILTLTSDPVGYVTSASVIWPRALRGRRIGVAGRFAEGSGNLVVRAAE